MTDSEAALWSRLRKNQLGARFRRQVPIGNYIVDFVCFDPKLVIELDGGQHAEQVEYDLRRTLWIKSQGFRLMRFWDNAVFCELNAVLKAIRRVVDSIPPP